MATEEITKVIFRKWPASEGGDVIAIFPEHEENRGLYSCYQHIGQHGACDRQITHRTSKAKPEEYAPLFRELSEQVGYNLKIVQRWPAR